MHREGLWASGCGRKGNITANVQRTNVQHTNVHRTNVQPTNVQRTNVQRTNVQCTFRSSWPARQVHTTMLSLLEIVSQYIYIYTYVTQTLYKYIQSCMVVCHNFYLKCSCILNLYCYIAFCLCFICEKCYTNKLDLLTYCTCFI